MTVQGVQGCAGLKSSNPAQEYRYITIGYVYCAGCAGLFSKDCRERYGATQHTTDTGRIGCYDSAIGKNPAHPAQHGLSNCLCRAMLCRVGYSQPCTVRSTLHSYDAFKSIIDSTGPSLPAPPAGDTDRSVSLDAMKFE